MKWLELRIPPPVIAVLFGTLGCYLTPELLDLPLFAPNLLAAMSVFFGLCFDLAGLWAFWQHRTTISPLSPQKASSLVTGGIYRITRNPMYVGLCFLLIGWGFYLQNLGALLLPILFARYLSRFQIEPEERILTKKFGPAYEAYRRQVARWL